MQLLNEYCRSEYFLFEESIRREVADHYTLLCRRVEFEYILTFIKNYTIETLRTTTVYDPYWKTLWMRVCFLLYDLKLGGVSLQDNKDEIKEQAETMMVLVHFLYKCRDV